MITPTKIDKEFLPEALMVLDSLYKLGKEKFNIIAPDINYDNFQDFAAGYLCGIEYVKQLMIHSSVYTGNYEWIKGDFIQKQGEV